MEAMDSAQRWDRVQERIAAACERSGRSPDGITVVAVSKTHGPEAVEELHCAGLRVFGENRVQEARAKIGRCPPGIEWHLIGHLQRNKARVAAGLFDAVHSVDSLRLIDTLDEACRDAGKIMPVFLEINVSGEGSKFGLSPEEAPEAIAHADGKMNLELRGLMTMPPFSEDPERARGFFRALRECRDQWREETGSPLTELSMGMSGDFEIAIEEGSTVIRLGTILFGQRGKPWKPMAE